MTFRGVAIAGGLELGACLLIASVFVALTLLPWWLAVALFVLLVGSGLAVRGHLRSKHRRRIELLERQAEINRAHIKAERIRRDALRCRGGVLR